RYAASWPRGVRTNVEVEDVRRDGQRTAGVGDVDDAADPSFDRRRSEQNIGLLARVAELLQVLDGIERSSAVGNVRIKIMLLSSLLVDRDALEDDILREVRLDRARLEDGIGDAVFAHAILDQVDANVDEARHLDGAAEGDLAIALRP